MIKHDENGPFVRAARQVEGQQTETVYAVEISRNGEVTYWDTDVELKSQEDVQRTIRSAIRMYEKGDRINGRAVSRQVTISATDWVADVAE